MSDVWRGWYREAYLNGKQAGERERPISSCPHASEGKRGQANGFYRAWRAGWVDARTITRKLTGKQDRCFERLADFEREFNQE